MSSPRNPSTRHLDGQNLKVTFLDEQLFVKDGSAREGHPGRFFARACPSMPFYNVIETATKLVTDYQSLQFITCVNDILCVLQRAFVWLWQATEASLGN